MMPWRSRPVVRCAWRSSSRPQCSGFTAPTPNVAPGPHPLDNCQTPGSSPTPSSRWASRVPIDRRGRWATHSCPASWSRRQATPSAAAWMWNSSWPPATATNLAALGPWLPSRSPATPFTPSPGGNLRARHPPSIHQAWAWPTRRNLLLPPHATPAAAAGRSLCHATAGDTLLPPGHLTGSRQSGAAHERRPVARCGNRSSLGPMWSLDRSWRAW